MFQIKNQKSKEKLNKPEISNKKSHKITNKISHNNVIANIDNTKLISFNDAKKKENNFYNNFSNNTSIQNNINPNKDKNNTYLFLFYSKNSKNNKIAKISNKQSLKYKKNIQAQKKTIKDSANG